MQGLSASEVLEARHDYQAVGPRIHPAGGVSLEALRAIVRGALESGGSSAVAQADAQRHIVARIREVYADTSSESDGLSRYRFYYELVLALCGEPDMFRLFAYQRSFNQRFLARIGVPSGECDGIFRDRLLRNLWTAIWGRDLRHLREADVRCIVQAQGLHNLPERWQRTGILFTHWHAPFTQVFWTWLNIAGGEPGINVGQSRWHLQQHELNDKATVALQSALDLRLAVKGIADGRHVHILPDALGGRRMHGLGFFGRMRPFQIGFTEIARRTQAPCHPVSVRLADGGDIVIRFAPEFAPPADDLPAEVFSRHLVQNYADHLAMLWRTCPADVDTVQIRGFMLMPPANQAVPAGAATPRIAFCAGMLSSGSTWVFNAVRQIWLSEAQPGRLKSIYTEKGTDLDTAGYHYFVVKTHLNSNDHWYGIETMIAASQAPIIISVRDPLDAVASLMLRFGMDFEIALRQVACSARSVLALLGRRADALIVRYEDGTIGLPETLDQIARHIGASPCAEVRQKIIGDLSTDAVQSTIAQLQADGVINAKRPFDPVTQWHAGHVGDGRIGKYAEVLSQERQALVAEQTAAFARRFGYMRPAIKPRLAVLTDLDIWRTGSFFAAWVAQCIEMIGRTLPIVVFRIGREGLPGAAEVSGLKVVHVAADVAELASALDGAPILGTAIACADPGTAALFRQAMEIAPACKGTPLLHFLARDGMPAQLAVTLPDGACIGYPVAQLYAARTGAMAVDRSRVLAIVAGDPHGWDQIVLACLERAARARGIDAEFFPCVPRAEHDVALHEKMAATRSPVIFIGSPVPAFEFCQAHLRNMKIPFLCISESGIFPLVRPRMGLPSLQQSIADFLGGAAPACCPYSVTPRWQQILSCLMPQ